MFVIVYIVFFFPSRTSMRTFWRWLWIPRLSAFRASCGAKGSSGLVKMKSCASCTRAGTSLVHHGENIRSNILYQIVYQILLVKFQILDVWPAWQFLGVAIRVVLPVFY